MNEVEKIFEDKHLRLYKFVTRRGAVYWLLLRDRFDGTLWAYCLGCFPFFGRHELARAKFRVARGVKEEEIMKAIKEVTLNGFFNSQFLAKMVNDYKIKQIY